MSTLSGHKGDLRPSRLIAPGATNLPARKQGGQITGFITRFVLDNLLSLINKQARPPSSRQVKLLRTRKYGCRVGLACNVSRCVSAENDSYRCFIVLVWTKHWLILIWCSWIFIFSFVPQKKRTKNATKHDICYKLVHGHSEEMWNNEPGDSPDTPGIQTYRSCCIGSPRSQSATLAGQLPEAPERSRKKPQRRVSWFGSESGSFGITGVSSPRFNFPPGIPDTAQVVSHRLDLSLTGTTYQTHGQWWTGRAANGRAEGVERGPIRGAGSEWHTGIVGSCSYGIKVMLKRNIYTLRRNKCL